VDIGEKVTVYEGKRQRLVNLLPPKHSIEIRHRQYGAFHRYYTVPSPIAEALSSLWLAWTLAQLLSFLTRLVARWTLCPRHVY
jgi:hypothetical protein